MAQDSNDFARHVADAMQALNAAGVPGADRTLAGLQPNGANAPPKLEPDPPVEVPHQPGEINPLPPAPRQEAQPVTAHREARVPEGQRSGSADDVEYEVARTVRPYAVTGGRVRAANSDLPLEALVEVLPGAASSQGLPPEKRAILQHAAHTFVSVAELSAMLRLPLGVVRVLVTDLSESGFIRVHTSTPVSVHTGQSPALSLSVLESVLNGISAL